MIYIGTSGYSYDDWIGPYYPPGLPKNAFLQYYSREFRCCEINYTYYRMPAARTLEAMATKVPESFRFTIKAPGSLTHDRRAESELFQQFSTALQPIRDRGQLGAVLAQFPTSFRPGDDAEAYLRFLRDQWPTLPVVIEFRHASWGTEQTLDLLRELGLGFCCVDEPRLSSLMPPLTAVTSRVGYLRLHGRNATKWFHHDEAWERYDYTYTPEELGECANRVREIASEAEETYVLMNNHYQAQAVRNSRQLSELLQEG